MAPSHVDLSVLWVPIMPETSKLGEQMEEVGKEATESFGKGSTGLGDKIHESVTKSRDKIKDVFHRTGSDAGKSMSDAFKEESKAVEDTAGDVGKKAEGKFRESTKGWGKVLVEAVGPETKKLLGDRLEDVVGGALSGVLGDNAKIGGQLARTVAEGAFDALTHKLGDVKVAAANTRQAFADFGKGDTTAGVTKLVDGMGKLGIETKDLPQPLQDVIGKTAELKGTAQGFADVFKDLPGQIGRIGTALGELAGPLGALGATMLALKDEEKAGLLDKTDASGHEDWWKLAGGVGGSWLEDKYNRLFHGHGTPGAGPSGVDMSGTGGIGRGGDVLGSSADAYDAFSNGSPLPSAHANAPAPTAAPTPSPVADMPSSFVGGASASASSPSDLHASGGRIANLYKVANALQGTPYSQALRNDCSGMVSKLATAALGMAPSVQFATPTEGAFLASHGFQPGRGPAGSFRVGWNPAPGNEGHTAATLPGGEHAESGGSHGDFRVGGGAVGADDPQFSQHAWLPMDGSAGGGQKSPLGSQQDPLFVSAAEKGSGGTSAAGGAAGDGSNPLAQQLGSGLLGGVAQSVGLDGSVFKTFSGASNPMDFGITKLGTGLMNWAGGMLPAMQGQHTPKQQPASPTYNVDQSFNLTQHGVQGDGSDGFKAGMNSSNRTEALASGLPG